MCEPNNLLCLDSKLIDSAHDQCPSCTEDSDCPDQQQCGAPEIPMCYQCWFDGMKMGVDACDGGNIRVENENEAYFSPNPEESEGPETQSACFPGSALVQLEDGSVKTMDELELGDRVQVSKNQYSEVFLFTHKISETLSEFMTIHTKSGCRLSLTAGHYIYVDGELKAAKDTKLGDYVTCMKRRDPIISISKGMKQGLYNPQTFDGNIVVDGFLTTTYINAVEYSAAHAILAPLRIGFALLGINLQLFENGVGYILGGVASIFREN